MRTRVLALDLDGTVLDPDGALTRSVRDAIAAAEDRGLQVVLCTGRRFRTALPVARELELRGPIVVNNGVLVKDIESGETRHHAYLPSDLYPIILSVAREVGPPLVYVDTYHEQTDLLTERWDEAHPFQLEYLQDHREHCRVVDDLAEHRRDDVIMVSMMADEATVGSLRSRGERALGARVRMHSIVNSNYRGRIVEFLSTAAGKWSALLRVAAAAQVAPEEIAAVGDDDNDAEMLRGAGLGVAMGNAQPGARAAADAVVGSNAGGGLIEAIERVLDHR